MITTNQSESSNGHHPQMLRMIPVSQIAPSPTNPRKYFDPAKLQELADSIQEHGLAQPILVRPVKQSYLLEDSFEIVAGERRWRAAKIAGLKEIEAKVRDLDDKAVLEIQFIENLQRTDLSPIEEAEGYKRLLDEHGYTADSLAGKLAKSKSYVYGRLKLCNLPEPALTALAKGDLPATVGELIGRLPSPNLREQFWNSKFRDALTPPSFRDVKSIIERDYMRELKGAPFSQTDKKLVPAAGDCKNCTKRTGNNRGDFPDGRADICTDVMCFKLKTKLFQERRLKEFAGEGATVLSEKESKQWFSWGGSLHWQKMKEFVDLADECDEARPEIDFDNEEDFEDKPGPSYGELIGEVKPDVVAYDDRGTLHRLVSKPRAAEILRSKHGIEIETPLPGADFSYSASPDRQKEREEYELRKKARGLALEQIAAKVAAWYDAEFISRFKTGYGSKSVLPDLLRAIAGCLLRNFDDWAPVSATLKRRDALNTADEVDDSDEFDQVVAKLLQNADAADLIGILAEVCVREELQYWSRGSDGKQFENTICDFAGLKIDEFEKQALKELKPEKKAKTKPKAKAVAKA